MAVADAADELEPGDEIVAIDGVPAQKRLEQEEAMISGATAQWRRYRSVDRVLRGTPGATAKIEFSNPASDETRELQMSYVVSRAPIHEPEPDVIAELEPGIWYVDLDRVTTDEFQAALGDLTDAEGVVFDMRGYPRKLSSHSFFPHLIQETVSSARWRVPRVDRPDTRDLEYHDSNWQIEPAEPHIAAKRAFITYGGAISYAETCMGIVEHYELGAIVGGHERQRQPVRAARRLQRLVDGDARREARREPAPRRRDPSDDPGRAHARGGRRRARPVAGARDRSREVRPVSRP
ncbi:MAG: hypothetical protein GY711_08150 [bacterium]|nr:hypothetical protein [bacterium]